MEFTLTKYVGRLRAKPYEFCVTNLSIQIPAYTFERITDYYISYTAFKKMLQVVVLEFAHSDLSGVYSIIRIQSALPDISDFPLNKNIIGNLITKYIINLLKERIMHMCICFKYWQTSGADYMRIKRH